MAYLVFEKKLKSKIVRQHENYKNIIKISLLVNALQLVLLVIISLIK